MDKLSLGCKNLNNLLGGGIESGIITNFYGAAGSGKTNICLQCAVSCLKTGKKAIYIDAEGGFSIERFIQMHPTGKKDLENLILTDPKTFWDQERILNDLEKELEDKNIGLIIVDSIVALYRLELRKDKIQEVNRILSKQFAILSKIARENKIPVIVTNQVYTDFDSGDLELVGRDIPRYFSKCLVLLEKTGNNRRKATLKKHRSRPEAQSAEFDIKNEGLVDTAKKFGIF